LQKQGANNVIQSRTEAAAGNHGGTCLLRIEIQALSWPRLLEMERLVGAAFARIDLDVERDAYLIRGVVTQVVTPNSG
jgi:hypothetical protein